MKLNELFEAGISRYREILNLVQNPREILTQRGRQAVQERFNEVELPLRQQSSQTTAKSSLDNVQNSDLLSAEPRQLALPGNTVTIAAASQSRSQISKTPPTLNPLQPSDIPLLPEDKDLRGRRGKYRCIGSARQVTEQSRLYDGILVFNQKPVLIKEYPLSERNFNARGNYSG